MLFSGLILSAAALATTIQATITPSCGSLNGDPANVNSGISLESIKTVVAFGDGYTDGGKQDGSTLDPPVQVPPNPRAGGRLTNGPVWVEYLAENVGATLKDYAVSESVVDNGMYPPSARVAIPDPRDFVSQANKAITSRAKPDSASTLIVLYVGMEDFKHTSALDFPTTAQSLIYEILRLSSSPLFGKNFLFVDSYGRGVQTEEGDLYKRDVFDGISALADRGLNVGFVDMGAFIADVKSDIGAAGFESLGPCTVNATTTAGQCANPDKVVYYIEDYPSTATHKLMADYALSVIEKCRT